MNSLAFSALLLVACGALGFPQGKYPSYAPNGVDYPRPFGSSNSDDINNRIRGTEETPRLNAYGNDVNLVNKAAALPESQQPFWYRNRELIADHIGLNRGASQSTPAAGKR